MNYDTRKALDQVGELAGVLISACLYCQRIYRVTDSAGGSTGVSDGYCDERCTPGFDDRERATAGSAQR